METKKSQILSIIKRKESLIFLWLLSVFASAIIAIILTRHYISILENTPDFELEDGVTIVEIERDCTTVYKLSNGVTITDTEKSHNIKNAKDLESTSS